MRDKLYRIWSDPRRPTFVLGFIAFNAGVGLGYILGRRSAPAQFDVTENLEMKLNSDELATLRDVTKKPPSVVLNPNMYKTTDPIPEYTSKSKTRVDGEGFVRDKIKSTVETAREAVQEVVDDIPEEDGELVRRSIFVESDDWNYELELSKRTTEAPYVIHRDEFFADEKDYVQSTCTYYAGDSILVDEDEKPIYNHEQITGQLVFGHGSGDANVVYIRNDKRHSEYEVVFDPGLYSVEVLGLEIEDNERVKDLRHSRVPKFRDD